MVVKEEVAVVVADVMRVEVADVVAVESAHSLNVPSWNDSIAAFRILTTRGHSSAIRKPSGSHAIRAARGAESKFSYCQIASFSSDAEVEHAPKGNWKTVVPRI